MFESHDNGTRKDRLTPRSESARTQLAAVASGLSLESFSDTDIRSLQGLVATARSALAAPYAVLGFFGRDRHFYEGPAEEVAAFDDVAKFCLEVTAQSSETIEIEDLQSHAAFRGAHFVRQPPRLRWMVSLPIRGYHGMVVGVLALFDDRPRMSLGTSDRGTLSQLAGVVESALESHRSRVMARAQRSVLVHRLRGAYAALSPQSGARRRNMHELSNALTIIRLNSQLLEENQEFDADALTDIRNSVRAAERASRDLRESSSTPHDNERISWARVCDWQAQRIDNMPQAQCEVYLHDESPNLLQYEAPACLREVACVLVDRALEASAGIGELTISLREFPHFIRLSVRIPRASTLEEVSTLVDPVNTHPCRNALVAIGGGITAESSETECRWSAWFPADAGHAFVI